MHSNIQKTTLYFDKDFYLDVKKTALEQGKTVTALINEAMQEKIQGLRTKPLKKRLRGHIFPGFKLGKVDKRWTREEIYDFI